MMNLSMTNLRYQVMRAFRIPIRIDTKIHKVLYYSFASNKKNHLIIIHRERKSFENFKDILSPIVTKQYGRSKIIFGKFLR